MVYLFTDCYFALLVSVTTCCYCFVCYIFFFKQKTAYEMRISDWSSDVCSSDLILWRRTRVGISASPNAERDIDHWISRFTLEAAGPGKRRNSCHSAPMTRTRPRKSELGRASSRVRECLYV